MTDSIAIEAILVSQKMMEKFTNYTSWETEQQGMETLGFAVGQEVPYNNNNNGYYQVKAIVIPDQSVTSNSCIATTDGNTSYMNFLDKYQFITLGMVHTHPIQPNIPSAPDCHALHTLDTSIPNVFSCIYSGLFMFYIF